MAMDIRLLYKEKKMPLIEAVSLYEQTFRPSLLKDEIKVINSRLRYKEPTHEDPTDWYSLDNNLFFTKAYMSIFPSPEIAVWIAYECLSLILKQAEKGVTDDMQIFTYNRRKFWVKAEDKHIVFLMPEDY